MDEHAVTHPSYKRAAVVAFTAAMFVGSILFGEFPLMRYTPENNRDIFRLMARTAPPLRSKGSHLDFKFQANGTVIGRIQKLLVCTMLTNNFHSYAAGAAKMAQAIVAENDRKLLWQKHLIHMEMGILEMQQRPIPSNLWDTLHGLGWQKKFTRPRIKPRNEGRQIQARFVDQFTKLHIWNLTEYDWILYMDCDIFILRSIVPMISRVMSSAAVLPPPKIWAVRDVYEFSDSFNMGTFMIQPSSTEFTLLLDNLHETNNQTIPFPEEWMEQGLVNAMYKNRWGEIPATEGGMHLAYWSMDRDAVWRRNASKIQVIHFTNTKPWDWFCPWTEYAPLCYLFWNKEAMRFHKQ